jgi:hypothetical protein
MQDFFKKSGVFYKKAHFLHFSFKIFGGLEKKLYLCSRKQKQV